MTCILVVYDSHRSASCSLAVEVTRGAEAAGADVRIRRCSEDTAWTEAGPAPPLVDADVDLPWADGIAVGAPVRFGTVSVELRAEIESWASHWKHGTLDGKAFTAFATSNSVQGGAQLAILGLYATICHFGGVIVPPGYGHDLAVAAGGNPYGTSFPTAESPTIPDPVRTVARHQGARLTMVARALAVERMPQ